jgi:anti-anti-sigma regulatory factor
MAVTTVDADGTLVIHTDGLLGDEDTSRLQRALVRAIRHTRPQRLRLDLTDVPDLDPISLGSLAAACHLADDHAVPVFVDHNSPALAGRLAAAGIPQQRLRQVT